MSVLFFIYTLYFGSRINSCKLPHIDNFAELPKVCPNSNNQLKPRRVTLIRFNLQFQKLIHFHENQEVNNRSRQRLQTTSIRSICKRKFQRCLKYLSSYKKQTFHNCSNILSLFIVSNPNFKREREFS